MWLTRQGLPIEVEIKAALILNEQQISKCYPVVVVSGDWRFGDAKLTWKSRSNEVFNRRVDRVGNGATSAEMKAEPIAIAFEVVGICLARIVNQDYDAVGGPNFLKETSPKIGVIARHPADIGDINFDMAVFCAYGSKFRRGFSGKVRLWRMQCQY